ncbi:MAG: hypothetical protein N0C81_20030 [Candidatus Thiodiazotropha lotti]|nr:hypothetical protein [Candidatus Thiodiazotropha lotti]MCG8009917.1 hypothetical protein [Candidatus Thiodiazotropha lotti]MCG8013778.1 hypothetical protein [Candidatus Thiodiazotropha lotti]MCG8021695.1 hypothetical protein [Candidatus Thiodiazotropha lotti]MCW4187588.1 hypothetical protein [Candidatus Thiodiazotropha lotti]
MTNLLVEQHDELVVEMAKFYLENMEKELGKKYVDNSHEVNASLSDSQYSELKGKYDITDFEFADLYNEFQKMKPTKHLKSTLDAFAASGGNVDIEPVFDEKEQKLNISISFSIKDQTYETIEGLSALEEIILKMNAMIQIDNVLSGADPDVEPTF